MEKQKYTTISIPKSLAKAIDEMIKSGKYTYRNRSDFALDAIRLRLRQLGIEV